MRLIDADKLVANGWLLCREKSPNHITVVQSIADVPTAYNMEKVVAELEEMRKCEDAGWCNHCQNKWCPLELLDADETIGIVRNGGKE